MAKIKLIPINALSPNGAAYGAEIDTKVMNVEIYEAFRGVTLVAPSGDTMTVVMRGGGFEVNYTKADE